MPELHKITHGFVTQRWDLDTGKWLGQEFTAGDDVQYEVDGVPSDEQEPNYEPFEMVQPQE